MIRNGVTFIVNDEVNRNFNKFKFIIRDEKGAINDKKKGFIPEFGGVNAIVPVIGFNKREVKNIKFMNDRKEVTKFNIFRVKLFDKDRFIFTDPHNIMGRIFKIEKINKIHSDPRFTSTGSVKMNARKKVIINRFLKSDNLIRTKVRRYHK